MKVFILITKRDHILYRGSLHGCLNYQSKEPRRVAVMRAGEHSGKVIGELLGVGSLVPVSSVTKVNGRFFY